MKPKTTAPVSAQLTKPAVEPTRTVSSVKQAVNSRLIAPSAASSATDDSDEETGAGSAADFFSLDAADQPAMFLAALRNSEAVDVRWDGSTSYIQPTATFVSHNSVNMSAASATNYTLPTADHLQGLDVTVCIHSLPVALNSFLVLCLILMFLLSSLIFFYFFSDCDKCH